MTKLEDDAFSACIKAAAELAKTLKEQQMTKLEELKAASNAAYEAASDAARASDAAYAAAFVHSRAYQAELKKTKEQPND